MSTDDGDDRSKGRVEDFYAGKSVFITGATGFIGMVVLEKLLYSCKKLKKLYILIRETKSKTADQRLQDIIKDPLFSRLSPQETEKIVPIVGDISKPNLGIRDHDEQLLIDEVSIVFHIAAAVKFNEALEVAMNQNYYGTIRILELTKRLKNKPTLIHVSTAYANMAEDFIEEQVYPPSATIADVNRFLEKHGSDNTKLQYILNGHPNTYTFTKALTENYLKENHGDVLTAIVRPSIVTATIKEPVEGWLRNWYGATGISSGIGSGLIRVIYGVPDMILDFIPVDYVSNVIIIAAAKGTSSKDISVYHTCTSHENPLKQSRVYDKFMEVYVKYGWNVLPYPSLWYTNSKFMLQLLTGTTQILPACIADFWKLMTANSEMGLSKQQSIALLQRDSVSYFSSNSWVFSTKRLRSLIGKLHVDDVRDFPCDPTAICWDDYLTKYCKGVQRHLMRVRSQL